MKKLSLIVALAVVLTIGGVFATWTYPGATVAPDSETIGVTIETSTSGADVFDVNNTMAISVDPTSNTDYTAKITKSGNIVITLDPATGSRVAAGETMTVAWTATLGNVGSYDGAPVFDNTAVGSGTLTFTNSDYEETIGNDKITIALADTFVWDSKTKYDKVSLTGCTITITFGTPSYS